MITIDKLNSLTLACMCLIQEREMEREQEVMVVAIKVHRSPALREKFYPSVKNWIPNQRYLTYREISTEDYSDN